jgi:hypothetical protein
MKCTLSAFFCTLTYQIRAHTLRIPSIEGWRASVFLFWFHANLVFGLVGLVSQFSVRINQNESILSSYY